MARIRIGALLLFTCFLAIFYVAGSAYGGVSNPPQKAQELPFSAFEDLRTIELSPIYQGSFEYTVDNTEITTNTVTNGETLTATCISANAATCKASSLWRELF